MEITDNEISFVNCDVKAQRSVGFAAFAAPMERSL